MYWSGKDELITALSMYLSLAQHIEALATCLVVQFIDLHRGLPATIFPVYFLDIAWPGTIIDLPA